MPYTSIAPSAIQAPNHNSRDCLCQDGMVAETVAIQRSPWDVMTMREPMRELLMTWKG